MTFPPHNKLLNPLEILRKNQSPQPIISTGYEQIIESQRWAATPMWYIEFITIHIASITIYTTLISCLWFLMDHIYIYIQIILYYLLYYDVVYDIYGGDTYTVSLPLSKDDKHEKERKLYG